MNPVPADNNLINISTLKTFLRIIIAIFVFIVVFLLIMVRSSHEQILKDALPKGSQIIEFYSEKPLPNGDYVVVAKIRMTHTDFVTLAMTLELGTIPPITLNPWNNSSICPWLVTPSLNDIVYFKKGHRFEIWLFYDGNYAYYCDRGW